MEIAIIKIKFTLEKNLNQKSFLSKSLYSRIHAVFKNLPKKWNIETDFFHVWKTMRTNSLTV